MNEGPPRLLALDVFRGATVAAMILVNNPGTWAALYAPLAHAPWHGVTPTDFVFPFFLFAVGNALALVLPRWQAAGTAALWGRVARRTLLIFGIGLLLNAAPFVRWSAAGELVARDWETLRVMGVLQRIALAYGAAALVVGLAGRRGAGLAVVLLLLGYAWACLALAEPGATHAQAYSLQGWFGTAIDRALLGEAHLYRGEGLPFDPEGLASTPPAVAQVLLGWWAGQWLLQGDARAAQRRLLAVGAALVLAGLAWAAAPAPWGVPLNKKIWTASYVLLTSGAAMALLALLLRLLDAGGAGAAGTALPWWQRGWVPVCAAFGRNALGLFVLAGLVPRVLGLVRWPAGVSADGGTRYTTPWPWLHEHVFAPAVADLRLASLLQSMALLALYSALALWLDRRRLYWRV